MMKSRTIAPWTWFLALAAAAVTATVYPVPIVASLAFTIAFLIVLSSIIAACTCRGEARFYWLGFAIVSTAYFVFALLLSYCWAIGREIGIANAPPPQANFITSYILAWIFEWVDPSFPAIQMVWLSHERSIPSTLDSRTHYTFMTIGHSIFTLILGLAGGWLGSWIHRHQMEVPSGGV